MEKTSQTGKRCCYLHQTDFPSRIPSSQEPRNSKGFCEDNLPPQMAEQNSQRRGGAETAPSSNPRPSRAVMRFLFAYQIQCWLRFQHTQAVTEAVITGQPKTSTFRKTKVDVYAIILKYKLQYFSIQKQSMVNPPHM